MKLAAFTAVVVLLAPGVSSAQTTPDDDKRACFSAVDEAQRLHLEHKLVSAREKFTQCARPVCPASFRNDCVRWLSEVQAALPTVVFAAKDGEGRDLIDVHVSVDGARVADTLVGTATDVDPGPHLFRFEWEGHPAVEQQAVIREGEKDRLIAASFSGGGRSPLPPASQTPPWRSTPSTPSAPIPAGVWILGGLGVIGGVTFASLFLSADASVNHLRSTCAPSCTASQVDGARTVAASGYVALGVGVASLGAAASWFVVSRGARGEAAAITVEPTWGGGRANLLLRY